MRRKESKKQTKRKHEWETTFWLCSYSDIKHPSLKYVYWKVRQLTHFSFLSFFLLISSFWASLRHIKRKKKWGRRQIDWQIGRHIDRQTRDGRKSKQNLPTRSSIKQNDFSIHPLQTHAEVNEGKPGCSENIYISVCVWRGGVFRISGLNH